MKSSKWLLLNTNFGVENCVWSIFIMHCKWVPSLKPLAKKKPVDSEEWVPQSSRKREKGKMVCKTERFEKELQENLPEGSKTCFLASCWSSIRCHLGKEENLAILSLQSYKRNVNLKKKSKESSYESSRQRKQCIHVWKKKYGKVELVQSIHLAVTFDKDCYWLLKFIVDSRFSFPWTLKCSSSSITDIQLVVLQVILALNNSTPRREYSLP